MTQPRAGPTLERSVIVSAVRSPVGRFQGGLSGLGAPQLGAVVVQEALRRAGLQPADTEDVILGNVLQAGLGQNPARQAAIRAGLPQQIPAFTVNQVCASGLRAVALAAQAVACGQARVVVAGGMENMSQAPYLLDRARTGYRLKDGVLIDGLIRDGLWCALADMHMGMTAERIAEAYSISRARQDTFALSSQRKAQAALSSGRFREEIVAIISPAGERQIIDQDETPRPSTTYEELAALAPAFKEDGTITAGNACGISDGAAALVVVEKEFARQRGLASLGSIRAWACVGVDPAMMGLGPVPAIKQVLAKAGLKLEDISLLEVNEAFAAQILAVGEELSWDWERVNVLGGAIALGHPLGATGARLLVTLLHEMGRRKAEFGLVALCVGGGQGMAMVIQRGEG